MKTTITTLENKTFKPNTLVTKGKKQYRVIKVWNRKEDNYTRVECALLKDGKETGYVSNFKLEDLKLVRASINSH